MKKIGKKIVGYILLLNFLAISFPIPELLHEHEQIIVECIDHEHQEINNNFKEECSHHAHFSEEHEKHICFYTYFTSPYIIVNSSILVFNNSSFDNFLLLQVENYFLKSFYTYLLRGPPSII